MILEAIQDWWAAIAGSTVVMSALSWLGVDTVRTVRRLDREKADRSELHRLMDVMEKRDDEARQSRRELHQKMDTAISSQAEINRDMARFMGRLTGRDS